MKLHGIWDLCQNNLARGEGNRVTEETQWRFTMSVYFPKLWHES